MINNTAFYTGISDFYFKNSRKDKRNVAPLWMNDEEKAEWKRGQQVAKERLWVK